jgi:hypothetical protein
VGLPLILIKLLPKKKFESLGSCSSLPRGHAVDPQQKQIMSRLFSWPRLLPDWFKSFMEAVFVFSYLTKFPLEELACHLRDEEEVEEEQPEEEESINRIFIVFGLM